MNNSSLNRGGRIICNSCNCAYAINSYWPMSRNSGTWHPTVPIEEHGWQFVGTHATGSRSHTWSSRAVIYSNFSRLAFQVRLHTPSNILTLFSSFIPKLSIFVSGKWGMILLLGVDQTRAQTHPSSFNDSIFLWWVMSRFLAILIDFYVTKRDGVLSSLNRGVVCCGPVRS